MLQNEAKASRLYRKVASCFEKAAEVKVKKEELYK